MGMDLKNVGGGTERFSNAAWRSVLELAYEYDWKPAGTEPGAWVDPETGELDKQLSPDPDEWSGTYFSNDYQWVTEEDAARIANALEDIPDHGVGEETVEYRPKMVFEGPGVPTGYLEHFSGAGKQRVRDFVAFCRGGAFFPA